MNVLHTGDPLSELFSSVFSLSFRFLLVCLFGGLGVKLWLPHVLRHWVPVLRVPAPNWCLRVCTGHANVRSHLVPDTLG